MIKGLETRCPWLKVTKVLWEFLLEGWYKYDTDGASRGNPGLSSYAFFLRNDKGDIKYVEGAIIENTTNAIVGATTILEACKHCKQTYYNQIII